MRRQRTSSILAMLRAWGLGLGLLVFALALVWLTVGRLSPWPVPVTMRHYLASESCYSASGVGLAPARRGEPGYWPKLDGDRDGISCELWTPDGYRAWP